MSGKWIGEAAVGAALSWNPFGPEAYARRDRNKAYRKARRKAKRGEILTPEEQAIMAENTVKMIIDGQEIERAEPTLKLRTSTKVGGVNVVAILGAAGLMFPFWQDINSAIVAACESGNAPAAVLGGMAIAGVYSTITARLTKSPAKPGAL